MIYGLYVIGFWDTSLLKDTIFWVLLLEIPLFVKTVEKAKDNHFFIQLIKEKIALIAIIEFILNFWTFGLIIEIIIIPIFIGFLYAISAKRKKYHQVKRFFDWIFVIFGLVVIINTVTNIIKTPNEIISIATLKEFLLPVLLLILNLPIVYGLALYNIYEQVFIQVKGSESQK